MQELLLYVNIFGLSRRKVLSLSVKLHPVAYTFLALRRAV